MPMGIRRWALMPMVQCQSPPKANSVEDKLAKAEARITGKISVITFASFQFNLQDSNLLPFESLRFVCPAREPPIGYGARGGIHQR